MFKDYKLYHDINYDVARKWIKLGFCDGLSVAAACKLAQLLELQAQHVYSTNGVTKLSDSDINTQFYTIAHVFPRVKFNWQPSSLPVILHFFVEGNELDSTAIMTKTIALNTMHGAGMIKSLTDELNEKFHDAKLVYVRVPLLLREESLNIRAAVVE